MHKANIDGTAGFTRRTDCTSATRQSEMAHAIGRARDEVCDAVLAKEQGDGGHVLVHVNEAVGQLASRHAGGTIQHPWAKVRSNLIWVTQPLACCMRLTEEWAFRMAAGIRSMAFAAGDLDVWEPPTVLPGDVCCRMAWKASLAIAFEPLILRGGRAILHLQLVSLARSHPKRQPGRSDHHTGGTIIADESCGFSS